MQKNAGSSFSSRPKRRSRAPAGASAAGCAAALFLYLQTPGAAPDVFAFTAPPAVNAFAVLVALSAPALPLFFRSHGRPETDAAQCTAPPALPRDNASDPISKRRPKPAAEARSKGRAPTSPNAPAPTPRETIEISRRLVALAPLFMRTAHDTLRTMEQARAKGDFETAQRAGHSLKGAARTYGFHELGRMGLELETAAAEADENRLRTLLAALAERLERMEVRFV